MKRDTKSNTVVLNQVLPLETLLVGQGLIYGIVNEEAKLVVVGSTTNLYLAIGRLMGVLQMGSCEYGTLKEDLYKCSVSVLETCGREELKVRTRHWIDHYQSRNYKQYKNTNPVLYTLSTQMDYYHGQLRYLVYLQNRRSDRTIVGVFKKKREMTEWIRRSYPDTSRIGRIVIHESMLECNRDSDNKKSSPA